MEPEYGQLLAAVAVFLCLDLAVMAGVAAIKRRSRSAYVARSALMKRLNRLVEAADGEGLAREYAAAPGAVLAHLRRLLGDISPGADRKAAVDGFLSSADLPAFAGPRLRSRRFHVRLDAYLALGLSPRPEALALLVGALPAERRPMGRLVALSGIARHPADPDFDALIAGVQAGKERDRAREVMALAPLARRLHARFDEAGLPASEAGIGLYLMSARSRPSEADWEKLGGVALSRDDALGEEAARALAEDYPARRFLEAFGGRAEPRFRREAARVLGRSLSPEALAELDPWFEEPALREAGIQAASEVLRCHPEGEDAFLRLIGGAEHPRRACLSRAIEHRLPYLLYHAALPLGAELRAMLRCLLDEMRTGIVLESLSARLPGEVREAYVAALREELATRPEAAGYLARHLEGALAAELGLPPPAKEEDRHSIPLRRGDKAFLASLAVLALAIFPVAFVLMRGAELRWLGGSEILYRFVFDFQFMFAFYTIAVNSGYFVLLLLSAAKLRSQALVWERDLVGVVSGRGILPSVAILAPAFNEEPTIVESVQSLLSLAYPSYQVVVVNDGSTDGTLAALVRAFGLAPASVAAVGGNLPTMPVRGVYRSVSLPNLLVVDKANGGKADALNVGLNFASGDYVCTIDADSVLDPQALVRAMIQVVASDRRVFAIGGNVFPVNGCVVEHGHLQEILLPGEPLARFQTVEYLRSFVAGRLGWTVLDGLLIISGAFGLFDRRAVMELGGYLTGKGEQRHDTVGEDMEIVVRLTRKDREMRRGGKVDYAYNANCWTEVPETWPAFRRQRDRWHRGLMEVLCFHRSMAFRPRYGAAGMLSLPYFFLFELIGPWLESLGYVVLALALAFNLIDPIIPLTVFAVAVSFGILISVASLYLAERQILYFRTKEFFKLLGVAVLENFGFRQITSMGRTWSNLQFLFVSKGWQKGGRKGFARRPAP